eukprot:4554116-Amphidinium_carterae.1
MSVHVAGFSQGFEFLCNGEAARMCSHVQSDLTVASSIACFALSRLGTHCGELRALQKELPTKK